MKTVYDKLKIRLENELEFYKTYLLEMNKEEILNHAYHWIVMTSVASVFDDICLDENEAAALLESDEPILETIGDHFIDHEDFTLSYDNINTSILTYVYEITT